jgi:APA family basic amino acid/polyamine antiporter
VLLGNFTQIVSYFVFVVVIFIALTVAALFLLRHRSESKIEYVPPGYPVTAILFLLLIAVLLFLLARQNTKHALIGVGVVALGIPVYYLLFSRGQSHQTNRGETS